MDLKSTQLFKNIKELHFDHQERALERQIYDAYRSFGLSNVDSIWLTEKVLRIIRTYKF